METKDLLKKVKKIEIKSRKMSSELFSGQYHSFFKGRGMTFSEVRPYQYGDDIRAIDWNVTARNNETYIKVFEEERELTLLLVVDASKSQYFGSSDTNKKEYIAEIAATLAFSAVKNNDKIGLLLYTDQVELFIPPKKGKGHVLRIIRELIEFEPKHQKTNLNMALEYLLHAMKKKAIVFVLSDFIDSGYEKNLQLLSKKHDVSGICVFDEKESQIQNLGIIPITDAETNETVWIDTNDSVNQENLTAYHNSLKKLTETIFKTSGTGLIFCHTQESYVSKLLTYFQSRR